MATTIVWSDAARRRAIEASTSEDDGDGRRACGWLVGASRCAESAHRSLIRLGDEVMTEETVGRFGVEVEEIRGMLPGGMRVIGAFVEVDLDAEARLEARAFYSALSRSEAMSVVGGNAGPFYVATVRGDDIEVFECGETTKRVEIVTADESARTRRAFRCALSVSFDARDFDDVRRELAEDVVFTARRGDIVTMLTSGRKVNQIVDEDSPVTNVCVRVRGSKHAVSDVSEAPVVRCDPRELFLVNSRKSVAHLDVVAFVEESDDVKNLIALLTSLLIEQTSRMEDVIRASKENIVEPRAFHFSPPGLGHWITVIYPFTRGLIADEASLASERRRLHERLGLPLDRAMLRVGNALNDAGGFGASASTDGRLRNVHEMGVPPSHVRGGRAHLVRGGYDYFHYMQDKTNDAGWGCAYRSLQTIFSWFRIQNYSTVPIPSHADIQSCLVKIGDKPSDFVGSKRWIGAVELSYVLDELAGFSSKILTVPSGHDIPSKARELSAHFDDVGTPIMMGGGALAYTLLGVDHNESTGECAFLILDPHYVGGEDARAVVPRWCGWKKAEDVFSEDFYNLLMPQPPREV